MNINSSKFKEKIINITLNVLIALFGIILLISFYTSFQVKILKHKYSNFFGYTLFEVQTPSMETAISAGDWIIVDISKDIKLNDVITYEVSGEFITHRVIEIYNDTYITKGDANSGKDEPVDKTQIVGKVDRVLGGFGILRKTLFNPLVLIFLIISLYLFNSLMKKDEKDNIVEQKIKEIVNKIIKQIKEKIKKKEVNTITNLTTDQSQINRLDLDKIFNRGELNFKPTQTDLPKLKEEYVKEKVEIKEEVIEEKPEEKTEEKTQEEIDDELSKTSLLRVIPVDIRELDETFLEIAKNELEEKNKEQAETAKKEEAEAKKLAEEQEEVEDDDITNIDLELINNNIKKSKNVIDKLVNIKKEEILELCLLFDDDIETNEPTIRSALMETYIFAKYYNYYNEKEIEYRGRRLIQRIEKVIKESSDDLVKNYKGSDKRYADKVEEYTGILSIVANLDHASQSINQTKAKREFFKEQIFKYYKWDNNKLEETVKEVLKIQKVYNQILENFLKQLDTNTFSLTKNKIVYRKNLFAVDIEHNINFSNIYSDYIIDKTYNEGIIAENKLQVLLTILMSKLVDDMINANFKNKYIIYFPPTLYKKVRKISTVLDLIDDEYAKSHIYILIDFEQFKQNQKRVKEIRKSGYRFVVAIDAKSKLNAASKGLLEIPELIFINKKDLNYENVISYIPKDLIDKIVYDDIFNKLNITEVKK